MAIIEYKGGQYEAEQAEDGNWRIIRPIYQGPKFLKDQAEDIPNPLLAQPQKKQEPSILRDFAREGPGLALGAVGGALGSVAGPLGVVGGGALGYATGRQLSDVLLGENQPARDEAQGPLVNAFQGLPYEAAKSVGLGGYLQQGALQEMTGLSIANLLGRGAGWLGRQKQSFLRDVVAPSQDEAVKAAQETADELGIKLTPGQRGSAFGAQYEAQRMNSPGGQPYVEKVKGQQQVVGKAIDKKFPNIQPHKIGEAAQKKLADYARTQSEAFEKAYDEAVKHIDVNPRMRMEARRAILGQLDETLKAQGLKVTPVQGGKYTVQVSRASSYGERGGTITAVDPRVMNSLASLRESAELTSGKPPTYQQLNAIRRRIGKEISRLQAEGVDNESLAVFSGLYGKLKDAQKMYLRPEGRAMLERADELFKAEKVAADKLGRITDMNPQNVLEVFSNKNADQLLFLKDRLEKAGAPQVFETMRKRYLRQVLDKAKSVDAFNKELDKLGSGVRERLFSDAKVKSAEDLARLRQFVEIPDNARFRPGQGNFRFGGNWKEIPLMWYANKKLGPIYDQAGTQAGIDALNSPYMPGALETTLKDPAGAGLQRLNPLLMKLPGGGK